MSLMAGERTYFPPFWPSCGIGQRMSQTGTQIAKRDYEAKNGNDVF